MKKLLILLTFLSFGVNAQDVTGTLRRNPSGDLYGLFGGTRDSLYNRTQVRAALFTKVDKVSGKGLSTEDYSTAEKSKLAGIATGATANQTDAYLLSRSNHTGSQAISTVTGLQTALDGKESPLTFSSPLVRSTNTISIPLATNSVNGYLSSADRTNFQTAFGWGNHAGLYLPINNPSFTGTLTAPSTGNFKLSTNTGATLGFITRSGIWKGTTDNNVGIVAETGFGVEVFVNGSGTPTLTIPASGDITSSVVLSAPSAKFTSGAQTGYVWKAVNSAGDGAWFPPGSSYKGVWNASTNSPSISDGTGVNGDEYYVSTSGTQFGRSFVAGSKAVYNGSIWEPVGSGSSVSAVNSMTGAVQINPSLVGNTLSLTGGTTTVDLSGYLTASSDLNASNIADGSVSNTEFQYINSLTSNAQTQLDSKITASSTNTLTNKSGNISQWTNDSGYKTSVSSGDVTGALGYTPTSITGFTGSQTMSAIKAGLSLDKTDVGLGNVENKSSATIRGELTSGNVTSALGFTPTSITGFTGVQTMSGIKVGLSLDKNDVGLTNVDNTSDASKPVSTATQTALNLKAPLASPAFTGTVSGITATMVGLGNVNNTSDASKPVSTATQNALDLKENLSNKSTSTSLGTSNTLYPTQNAVKTYADTKLPLSGGTLTGTLNGTDAVFSGDVTANSDSTLKKNIKPLVPLSTALREIGAYSYDWKSNDAHAIGMIAQEVQKYFPELVKTDKKGILSINYQNFNAVLLQGWKELDERITKLEQR